MQIVSSAFQHGGEIPSRYTCEGEDAQPDLSWSGLPGSTASLALIVDDPDAPDPEAPKMTYVHWVLFNLDPHSSIPENAQGLPSGINDWKRAAWGGPCPPIGRHRYFFKLYALDTRLDLAEPTKEELLQAMEGHILAQAELMGTYQKHSR